MIASCAHANRFRPDMRWVLVLACLMIRPFEVAFSSEALSISSIYSAIALSDEFIAKRNYTSLERQAGKWAGSAETKPLSIYASIRIRVATSKVQDARSLLVSEFGGVSQQSSLSFPAKVVFAESLRSIRDYKWAQDYVNDLINKTSDIARARATELLADILIDQGKWEDALSQLDGAERLAISCSGGDDERACADSIRQKKQKTSTNLDLIRHGHGFVLYVTGNKHRLNNQWGEAVTIYTNLITLHEKNRKNQPVTTTDPIDPRLASAPIPGIYAAAGHLYRAQCLIALANYKGAKQDIDWLLSKRTPYLGEAQRLLGDIALEDEGDVKDAAKSYTNAIATLSSLSNSAAEQDEDYAIPSTSLARVRVASQLRTTDSFGNIKWATTEPDKVYTASSCPWYADSERMIAHVRRSICRFIANDTTGAVSDLSIISEVDREDSILTSQRAPSNYLRLSTGYQNGRLFATAPELALFRDKLKIRICLAEVAFETERWDEAITRYKSIYAADKEKSFLTLAQRAYIEYALACALTYNGQSSKIGDIGKGFEGPRPAYANTYTYWRAIAYLANKDRANEAALLGIAAEKCPDVSLRIDYQLKLALLLVSMGNLKDATTWTNAAIGLLSKDDVRTASAKDILRIISKRSSIKQEQ